LLADTTRCAVRKNTCRRRLLAGYSAVQRVTSFGVPKVGVVANISVHPFGRIFEHGKKLNNGVFWDVTPCGSCKNRRFGGT
jgi:hypothetical protein